jgi:signal transduction histidine kinase
VAVEQAFHLRTNSVRLSGACRWVARPRPEAERVPPQVRDDGRGFQPDDCCRTGTTHIGLDAMRERLQLIGSTLTVDSRAGGPTTITAVIEKWQPP